MKSIIKGTNVSVQYGPNVFGLESVSFEIPKGQVTTLLGRSGAGKTTMLRCLNGLQKPTDGYTWFGLTSSVVSKAIQARQENRLNELEYISPLGFDYECVIARRDTLESFDALRKFSHPTRPALWVGPAPGGTDHLFARKVWSKANLRGRWIPYKSGGRALAALLGRHGDVYVGNPQDTVGREALHVVAVASPERLPAFPNAPTFQELGLPALTGETLWRGVAVRKGTPSKRTKEIFDLLQQVVATPEWRTFLARGNLVPPHQSQEEFSRLVAQQVISDKTLLTPKG